MFIKNTKIMTNNHFYLFGLVLDWRTFGGLLTDNSKDDETTRFSPKHNNNCDLSLY